MSLRCSICDHTETKFIFNDWHCNQCSEVIRQTVGDVHEEDIINLFESDDNGSYSLTMDTADYSSLEDDG